MHSASAVFSVQEGRRCQRSSVAAFAVAHAAAALLLVWRRSERHHRPQEGGSKQLADLVKA